MRSLPRFYSSVRLLILSIMLLPGVSATQITSEDLQYTLDIPDSWTGRAKFSAREIVLAAISPKESPTDDFTENLIVMVLSKKAEDTVASVAKDQDVAARARRPDFAVSDEQAVTISGYTGVVRVCTMTFPEFVSKNRQYVLDVGDSVVIMTASVPAEKFSLYDQQMVAIAESFRRVAK